MRGDIINVFKVMNNFFDYKVTMNLFTQEKTERTRGHSQKLTKTLQFGYQKALICLWNNKHLVWFTGISGQLINSSRVRIQV